MLEMTTVNLSINTVNLSICLLYSLVELFTKHNLECYAIVSMKQQWSFICM